MWYTIWEALSKGLEWKSIKKLWRKKEMHNLAYELVPLLAMNDDSWQYSSTVWDKAVSLEIPHYIIKEKHREKQEEQDVSSQKAIIYTPLLMAACNGIIEIVEWIIHFHPQSIEHVSADEQNILHMAVKHRQLEIYQMLNKLKMVRHLAGKIDKESNTVLHNAAYFKGGSQPSYALQLQEELLWFEDDGVDGGNMRNHHVTKENSDSLSSVSAEENSMNLSRLYPELPEESFERNEGDMESLANIRNQRKCFYYDAPLNEDTGVWIPVSVPPMLEDDHKEWEKGFHSNGGFFPDDDMGWNQYVGGEKELTMWEVLVEILLAARGKVSSLASGDIHTYSFSWLTSHVLEQAWREMAQTLTEASFGNVKELIEAEPPKWLADSAAAACMLCGVRFHPIMCSRHHCRFCGGIFCGECSKGRSLMPSKFRVSDPQRVCDVCCVRLESVQPYLMDHVSNAAQLPTHDLTDLSTLRSWVNFPWGQTMEYEIYKATNTIKSYNQIGLLKPEKTIPDAILRQAKGLAIITVVKVGVVVTYNIGTGIVVARREDGSWSPPSAVSTFGVGWGAQAGGELTDFIIVLRTNEAVKTFSGNAHVSLGAGMSAAVGVVGRAVEADVRAGDGGYAACYTYSCSKGAFVGCSLEGSIVTTRTHENCRFYGSQSLNATDILLGSLPRPPAAAILYRALADLYLKIDGY